MNYQISANAAMIRDIEKRLNTLFPKKLKKNNAVFFMGEPSYELDLNALNKNLNIPARDFILRGGKRLRPVLFLTALKAFGVDYKKYIDLSLLIEIVHNGTLVHDDIEDSALLRRGKPACHVKFGIDTAINTGFGMEILPLKFIINSSKDLSDEQKLRLWQIYAEEMINATYGQALDIYWHKYLPKNVSKKQYLEMVRLKTGSLMRMSLRMACVVAGKDEKVEKLFKRYAESMGMAFQIKDDLLDLNSTNPKFGKAYGNDITEGKMSLPVVYTIASVSKKKGEKLLKILEKHTRDKRLIKKAISIIKNSGSVEKADKYAEKLADRAWSDLEASLGGKIDLNEIKNLTYFVIRRDH